jgi:hypothetical protein
MTTRPSYSEWFSKREIDCRIERHALEMWLGILTPIRWSMVIAMTVLSAIGGATILQKSGSPGPQFLLIAGVCTLIASIFSALHTALGCDAHQAVCRRLVSEFRGLESAFEAAQLLTPEQGSAKLRGLEKRYEKLVAESGALVPVHFRRRAERERPAESRMVGNALNPLEL